MNWIVSLSFLFISSLAHASVVYLSEDLLAEKANGLSPELDRIESIMLSAQLGRDQVNEQFAPELFGQASYAETNEKAIIEFIPIFSPIKQAQIGVRQKTSLGLSASAAVSTDQRSAVSPLAKYRNITTSILSFTVRMDIWKDLFGKISKTQIETADLESKKANLEKGIQNKTFKIALRRLYLHREHERRDKHRVR